MTIQNFTDTYDHISSTSKPLMHIRAWASSTLRAATRYLPRINSRDDGTNTKRILTWNCQGAYRRKAAQIAALRPDIAVIQECEPPDKLVFPDTALPPTAQAWFGEGKKGIGVFSYTGYTFELFEDYDPSIKYCIPLRVNGDKNFHLIAVWTKVDPERKWSYFGQIYRALQRYQDFLREQDSFLIGDFNWNAIWDNPRGLTSMANFNQEMDQAQMTSYYHHFFGEPFGHESKNTFFMYRRLNRGFHIDYCFRPTGWLTHMRRVCVGDKKKWLSQSDHCPLIVELALPMCIAASNSK